MFFVEKMPESKGCLLQLQRIHAARRQRVCQGKNGKIMSCLAHLALQSVHIPDVANRGRCVESSACSYTPS